LNTTSPDRVGNNHLGLAGLDTFIATRVPMTTSTNSFTPILAWL
jgi:hypothetical protein